MAADSSKQLNYCILLKQWCKVHPGLYEKPYFSMSYSQDKMHKTFTLFVNKGRVNWRGIECTDYSSDVADDDCFKDYLHEIMENKSFQDHFDTIRFSSIEELALKLALCDRT